jgi:antitoxin VapB
MLSLSRPGVTLGEIFLAAKKMYAVTGFPDEIEKHHQGGTCGYQGREVRAKPSERFSLCAHQAAAFNPTIAGAKSEDTIMIQEEGRAEIISVTQDWPMIHVTLEDGQIYDRPDILVR